jgi:predicted nucleotidyltransferase
MHRGRRQPQLRGLAHHLEPVAAHGTGRPWPEPPRYNVVALAGGILRTTGIFDSPHATGLCAELSVVSLAGLGNGGNGSRIVLLQKAYHGAGSRGERFLQSRTLIEANLGIALHRQADIRAQNVPILETALRSLLSHEAELRAAGVRHAAVFGSVARGDATASSDIDVLVELDPEARVSLYALMGIELRLRDVFGRKVDVVSRRGLRPRLDDGILEDAVSAF